ncbi:hypothetical protein [Arthrobacter sp. NPDC090010]|uniref:hypothetical protein n=1 Tax=Arthrobacter sp. NPDC090010 TaxID=3363942 RepID=UPI00381E21DE
MTAREARLVRGWIAAAAATSIAAASHVLAGGATPAAVILLLSLALSGLVCTLLAGRALSLWRLALGVVTSQGLFHWLFSMAPGGMHSTMPSGAPHGAHAAHTLVPLPGGAGESLMMDHSSPAMWLGHAVAAAFTIAVLRHGEVTTLRLLAALRMRLIPALPLVRPLVIRPDGLNRPAEWLVIPLRNLGVPLLAMRHRGPPLLPTVS